MSNLKNILVLGATGASGRVFVPIALEHPSKPHLTLLVRTPSKLPLEWTSSERITIVQGELANNDAVNQAMEGVTSVISLLGAYITLSNFVNRSTETPIADALPVVFAAMRAHGVKRIMALSSIGGFTNSKDQFGWNSYWLFTNIMPKLVVPEGAAEMKRIAEVVSEQADLEWTVFRIPKLHDGDAEGKAIVETADHVGPDFKGTIDLSRTSMAKWILRELDEGQWMRKACVVGNP